MISEALPFDPALPYLQVAWSPRRMTEVFRAGLQPVGSHPIEIVRCRIERFRYRRATRAILLYSLSVRRRPGDPVTKHWVTGVMYHGSRAKRLFRKLVAQSATNSRQVESPLEPVSYIAELEMVVQAYPFDRYLPALPGMVSARSVVDGPVSEIFGSGRRLVADMEVVPLRYRPFQGAALRYDFDSSWHSRERRGPRRFHAKIYRDDTGVRTYRLMQRIRSSGFRSFPFSTPAPVAYVADRRALFVEAAPGLSLQEALEAGPTPSLVVDLVCRAAAALAALHRSRLSTDARWTRSHAVERARTAGSFIKWACPWLTGQVDAIVAAHSRDAEEAEPALTHMDIKPDHIFLKGERGYFIDLDTAAMADPVVDAANLFARLEALPETCGSRVTAETARMAADVFLEEYFLRVPAAWRRRFSFNYSQALLQLSCFPLRHRERSWPQKTTALLEKAAKAAAGAKSPRSRIAVSAGVAS